MNRRWLSALLIGTGLACGASVLAPALAQDEANQKSNSSSARNQDNEAAQKIDKTIQAYQSRSVQDLDQTRKDLDRMRKELRELLELRIDMAISAAELRADVMNPGYPRGNTSSASAGYPGSAENQAGEKSERDRQNQEAAAVTQELRQVQDLLRSEIQQARNQTDQFVAQLRDLRAQYRQRQEQMKAEQERNRSQSNRSDERRSDEKK
jgi:hypothetical protein